MSESDVYRRQIMTTKVDPCAVRVNERMHTMLEWANTSSIIKLRRHIALNFFLRE